MTTKFRIEYDWEGGHPSGCINFSKGAWIVRFNDGTRKQFNEKHYGYEEAKRLAEEWHIQTSLEKCLTRNQYRRIEDDIEGIYYEMKLQDHFIAKIDEFTLPLALKCVWSAKKGAHTDARYMEHSGKKKEGIPPQRFHRLICPLFKEVDHINRDGLDNRIKNLRNGGGSVNKLNQCKRTDNASGKTGVHFSKSENLWVVQYPMNGKRRKKTFSVSKYGDEGAKEMAISWRKHIDEQFNISNGY
jgi:hypothetical protein